MPDKNNNKSNSNLDTEANIKKILSHFDSPEKKKSKEELLAFYKNLLTKASFIFNESINGLKASIDFSSDNAEVFFNQFKENCLDRAISNTEVSTHLTKFFNKWESINNQVIPIIKTYLTNHANLNANISIYTKFCENYLAFEESRGVTVPQQKSEKFQGKLKENLTLNDIKKLLADILTFEFAIYTHSNVTQEDFRRYIRLLEKNINFEVEVLADKFNALPFDKLSFTLKNINDHPTLLHYFLSELDIQMDYKSHFLKKLELIKPSNSMSFSARLQQGMLFKSSMSTLAKDILKSGNNKKSISGGVDNFFKRHSPIKMFFKYGIILWSDQAKAEIKQHAKSAVYQEMVNNIDQGIRIVAKNTTIENEHLNTLYEQMIFLTEKINFEDGVVKVDLDLKKLYHLHKLLTQDKYKDSWNETIVNEQVKIEQHIQDLLKIQCNNLQPIHDLKKDLGKNIQCLKEAEAVKQKQIDDVLGGMRSTLESLENQQKVRQETSAIENVTKKTLTGNINAFFKARLKSTGSMVHQSSTPTP